MYIVSLFHLYTYILTKNTLGVKKSCGQELKKARICEIKMGGQGLCSVTADQNKILIITSQAAKQCLFCAKQCYVLRPDL